MSLIKLVYKEPVDTKEIIGKKPIFISRPEAKLGSPKVVANEPVKPK